jgi:hypothetical protein
VDEVSTSKEVATVQRQQNCGDQLPLQNSAVGGTVDSNSRGLMSAGVNAQRDPSTSSTGIFVFISLLS